MTWIILLGTNSGGGGPRWKFGDILKKVVEDIEDKVHPPPPGALCPQYHEVFTKTCMYVGS